MQLHTLQPKHSTKNKRPRVGRGGKRGTTAGKGTKGQKARSGHRIRPAMREYIQRLPKLRGYNNKSIQDYNAVVSLTALEKLTSPVTVDVVVAAGLAKKGQTVKILGKGELKKAIKVQGILVSASAKAAIEKAGGSVL
jgi:large subunit ribosomal protein L15